MTPVTDVPRLPTPPPTKGLHSAAGIKEVTDAVGPAWLPNGYGRFKKRGEEFAARPDKSRQLPKAQLNVPLVEVAKQRLRDAEVRPLGEFLERKAIRDDKFWTLGVKHASPNFIRLARFDNFRVLVDSQIVSGCQVRNQQFASTQGATSDVQEHMARLEALLNEEVKLQLTHLIPPAAHEFSVAVSPEACFLRSPRADVLEHLFNGAQHSV
jgi:hypothetical protein